MEVISSLMLHRIHFVYIRCSLVAEERNQDGDSDGRFCGGNRYIEERKDLFLERAPYNPTTNKIAANVR
jgi:hypothetical protein